MPEMILNRNKLLNSRTGHTANFVKGQPVFVHKELVAEAMAIGAELVDKDETPFKEEQPLAPIPEGQEREEAIIAAMAALRARNNRGDFSGSGVPDLKKLVAIVGFDVDSKERNRLWDVLLERERDAVGA